MPEFLSLKENEIVRDAIYSIVFFVVLLIVRWIAARTIRSNTSYTADMKRRFQVTLRNGVLIFALLGLFAIWSHELRAAAVSLVAIAAAIVLAVKELIMCISGSLVRSRSDLYDIGDRIEVGTVRGDVIDRNLFSTTVLEVSPMNSSSQRTGRTITFPNSLLLSMPVTNENFFAGSFTLRVLSVPISTDDNWQIAEPLLERLAIEETASYIGEATTYFDTLAQTQAIRKFAVAPDVTIETTEPHRITLILRVPVPSRGGDKTLQAILTKFLREFYKNP
jgi:small-conductance mechanosensitive channel